MKLLIHTFDTYMIHFHKFIPNPFGIPESFTVLVQFYLDHDIIEFADVQAESPGATDEEQEPPTDPGGTNAREEEVMKII